MSELSLFVPQVRNDCEAGPIVEATVPESTTKSRQIRRFTRRHDSLDPRTKRRQIPFTPRVQAPMSEVSFGPFLLDPSSTRLLRDGVEVKLRPQAFQALRTLLRHSGQSIGYEQMMAEAWEGTFVSRHTVDVTIGEVRKSLGEYGRWITHRPKVGYCLEVPAGTIGTGAPGMAPIVPSTASSARPVNAQRISAPGRDCPRAT
jgi:DNA-binding winged helix-turn-helix (wHTH) protein